MKLHEIAEMEKNSGSEIEFTQYHVPVSLIFGKERKNRGLVVSKSSGELFPMDLSDYYLDCWQIVLKKEQIKPCPFCRHDPEPSNFENIHKISFLYCHTCKICFVERRGEDTGDLVERWNRRV